jgi:hypothetical protein
MWNMLDNRFVREHIRGKEQATEIEFLEEGH